MGTDVNIMDLVLEVTEEETLHRVICAEWTPEIINEMIPGSATTECIECSKKLIIAPSGLDYITKHNARAICAPCADKVPSEDREYAPPTPEQITEMLLHLSPPERIKYLMFIALLNHLKLNHLNKSK